jgi:glycosyltransferase involved in cell wall biosynthesis
VYVGQPPNERIVNEACRPLSILFIEAFSGGSHEAFAKGLAAHTRHHMDLVSLPARFWKWRMRGAALYLAPRISDIAKYDLVISSSMMSLSDFSVLMGRAMPPALLYFHENQLTYPLPDGAPRDMQFGFTDISSALAASRVCFNSAFHRDQFFRELPGFIRKMPEYYPDWVADAIRGKSLIRYPGVDLPCGALTTPSDEKAPPLIIWNHRWEFDKDPEAFFGALKTVAERGIAFRLAILGENFQACPQVFINAREDFSDQIVAYGYERDRSVYWKLLSAGRLVVSTAIQENFGISVVEAVHCGCLPLLPRRLAYPEVIPADYHDVCLYDDRSELADKLCRLLAPGAVQTETRQALSAAMSTYSWPTLINGYDDLFEAMARKGRM